MIEHREALSRSPDRRVALDCLVAGVRSGDPETVHEASITVSGGILTVNETPYELSRWDRELVVGAGKAAGRQARAIEGLLGDRIDRGIVISTEQVTCNRIEVRQGDHPIPSDRNVSATREIRDLLDTADERTLVIALISGGGSALLVDPAEPVALDELRSVTTSLLESGAAIDEINAVRKHLSRIKGGGLARIASPATVVAVLMSDVVGDDPATIASGPTVADETTYADAQSVLERYGIDPPTGVRQRLTAGTAGELPETLSRGHPALSRTDTHIVASGMTTVLAAADAAHHHGYKPLVLSTRVRGEARHAAEFHRDVAAEVMASGHPVSPPAVLLSGGETTVHVVGDGHGGPNQEFALAAAIDCHPGMTVASIDTDGIDGSGPAAGGVVDVETVEDPEQAHAALANNDAYTYLADRDDAIVTGKTGTNLNDLRVIVIADPD